MNHPQKRRTVVRQRQVSSPKRMIAAMVSVVSRFLCRLVLLRAVELGAVLLAGTL